MPDDPFADTVSRLMMGGICINAPREPKGGRENVYLLKMFKKTVRRINTFRAKSRYEI